MLTVRYISSQQIEKDKWNTCVANAPNGLVYACTDFLDHLSDYWMGAVVGNYEAVFPIPYRRKMGIRYVCMPAFSQQMGLFGPEALMEPYLSEILKHIALNYRLADMMLNFGNVHKTSHRLHLNLTLPLQDGYAAMAKNFKQDLQKNLTRAAKFDMVYEATDDLEKVIALYHTHYGQRMGMRNQDYRQLLQLANSWHSKGRCFARIIRGKQEQDWHACALFLRDDKRIYNLANTTLPNGRTIEANHVLLHELIKEFAGQRLWLDFEGSDLPGIARFYRKFGPQEEWYYEWKSNRLPAVMRWWKR